MPKSSTYVTKTSYDIVLVKFWKVTSENLKVGKLPFNLATSDFQELFAMKFDVQSSWLKQKSFCWSYPKKKR